LDGEAVNRKAGKACAGGNPDELPARCEAHDLLMRVEYV
jgi:hypothetical protein